MNQAVYVDEEKFGSVIIGNERYNPQAKPGVKENLGFVPPKDDDPPDKAAFKKGYQERINTQFENFVNDLPNDLYLAFQPMWNAKTHQLAALEVLIRSRDGTDNAPMPGMAAWQGRNRDMAMRFLEKQCRFAADACQKLMDAGLGYVRVSVNVRPDEVAGAAAVLEDCAQKPNFLVEITEYAPITSEVLATIKMLKERGVSFALDDVTHVEDPPGKGFAKPSAHACSFEVAKATTELFDVQKLALPLSCSVFRAKVFPTPQYAGGAPLKFMEGMIFPEDQKEEINKRKAMVESWVAEVREKNPATTFVIECSVYPEDLADKPQDLFPNIGLFDGTIWMQGGKSGGRAYALEAFLEAK